MDKEQLRSLTLAFLMIGSVMLGLFFIGVETDVSDRPPAITGENPGDFLVGEVTSVTVTVTDESVDEIYLEVSLNNAKLPDTYLDKNGQYVVDITGLNPGTHSLSILARDYLNQEANWETQFTISYPDEGDAEIILDNFATTIAHGSDAILSGNLSHTSIETCDFVWSDSDIEQEQLNVPMGDDGLFSMVFSELNENLTITMEANCGENIFSTDKTTINYIVEKQQNDGGNSTNEDNNTVQQPNDEETHRAEFWNNSLHCHGDDIAGIDDYNTTDYDNHICALDYEYNETHIVIQANGIPAHDLESGPGCCTASQDHVWTIPLEPTNNSECTPSISSEGCEMAPIRGAVAFAVNGVPIFGPEDGPGGDAVAGQEGQYEEDRQHVWLGLCHGHSGPGGEYHYHADANCVHWHPDEDQSWRDYSLESSRTLNEHSGIVGFAFDGYPIYGFVGWDDTGEVSEMTSSYRLKEGETGYNGIEDYEYIAGMGDLDSCNGQYGATPDFPDGIYHYHSTWANGEGDLGFPYFILCYRGIAETSNYDTGQDGGGDTDCSGYGETWGPGIGPPPEGCGGGGQGGGQGQSSESGLIAIPWFNNPPNSGAILLTLLTMAVVSGSELQIFRGSKDSTITVSASQIVAQDPVGTILEYHPSQEPASQVARDPSPMRRLAILSPMAL